jgi:hypothetical protein
MKCQKQPLLTIQAAVSKEKPDVTTSKEMGLVNLNQDVIFCNTEFIVHKEFISVCQAVSLHCYWEVLQRLRKQVC